MRSATELCAAPRISVDRPARRFRMSQICRACVRSPRRRSSSDSSRRDRDWGVAVCRACNCVPYAPWGVVGAAKRLGKLAGGEAPGIRRRCKRAPKGSPTALPRDRPLFVQHLRLPGTPSGLDVGKHPDPEAAPPANLRPPLRGRCTACAAELCTCDWPRSMPPYADRGGRGSLAMRRPICGTGCHCAGEGGARQRFRQPAVLFQSPGRGPDRVEALPGGIRASGVAASRRPQRTPWSPDASDGRRTR